VQGVFAPDPRVDCGGRETGAIESDMSTIEQNMSLAAVFRRELLRQNIAPLSLARQAGLAAE
jgi:hypothetical protein